MTAEHQDRTALPFSPGLTEAEQSTWLEVLRFMYRVQATLDIDLRRAADLALVEYNVLASLSGVPGHSARMTDIAQHAHLSPSRLSHLIARLERRGLVMREPGKVDGRSIVATLTDHGRSLLAEIAQAHSEDVRRLLFDHLSDEQSRDLGVVLSRTRQSLP